MRSYSAYSSFVAYLLPIESTALVVGRVLSGWLIWFDYVWGKARKRSPYWIAAIWVPSRVSASWLGTVALGMHMRIVVADEPDYVVNCWLAGRLAGWKARRVGLSPGGSSARRLV